MSVELSSDRPGWRKEVLYPHQPLRLLPELRSVIPSNGKARARVVHWRCINVSGILSLSPGGRRLG